MNSPPETISIQRYIGIDIHKYYLMIGGQNIHQEWTLRPRQVQMPRFRDWAEKNSQARRCGGDRDHRQCLGHL